MTIGTCYFPEHWPRERWETDVRAMDDAVIGNTLYLAGDDQAALLERYVEDGDELLVTMRAGVKSRDDQLHEDLTPGRSATS